MAVFVTYNAKTFHRKNSMIGRSGENTSVKKYTTSIFVQTGYKVRKCHSSDFSFLIFKYGTLLKWNCLCFQSKPSMAMSWQLMTTTWSPQSVLGCQIGFQFPDRYFATFVPSLYTSWKIKLAYFVDL